MSRVTTYTVTQGQHRIELEFDTTLIVLNRVRLKVDGQQLDDTRVFYGEKELTATLPEGDEIAVRLHSGMVGEIDRPQLRRPDGTWVDVVEG